MRGGLKDGTRGWGVGGGVVVVCDSLGSGAGEARVDSGVVLVVVGLGTGTVFRLSGVDLAVLRAAVVVFDLDVRLGGGRLLRSADFLAELELFADAGTVVSFLVTSDADLFFDAGLFTRRQRYWGWERRVLTYQSGGRDLDLELFVDVLCLGGGLRLPV